MMRSPRRISVAPASAMGALVALGATALLAAAPAGARVGCPATAQATSTPQLLSPCRGAVVPRHHAVTFTALDRNSYAAKQPPFLNLDTSRTLTDGHLTLNRDANGIFGEMTAVSGHPNRFTYTASRQIYPSWWDNHRGTYYVQMEQVDPRVPSGIIYGPITTVRVR